MSVALARKSMAFNGLTDRVDVRCADFRDPTALAPDERFDLVLGSPPYFPVGSGIEGDHPQKVACRFELRGDITDYCAVAVRHLAPGGVFACVFPQPDGQRERLLGGRVAPPAWPSSATAPSSCARALPPLLALYAMTRAIDLPEPMRGQTWVGARPGDSPGGWGRTPRISGHKAGVWVPALTSNASGRDWTDNWSRTLDPNPGP